MASTQTEIRFCCTRNGWGGPATSLTNITLITECNALPSNPAACQMNGWNLAAATGAGCESRPNDDCPYAYVPANEVQPYSHGRVSMRSPTRCSKRTKARASRPTSSLISGTIRRANNIERPGRIDNPLTSRGVLAGGCDSKAAAWLKTLSPGRVRRAELGLAVVPSVSPKALMTNSTRRGSAGAIISAASGAVFGTRSTR